jgi:hypothetical protein
MNRRERRVWKKKARRVGLIFAAAALAAGTASFAGLASADPSGGGNGVGKTCIVHIADDAQENVIWVGNPAVEAHLAHGDFLCED